MSPAGGKSNKNDWRHFGYWWKSLCSARRTHLLGIPWRARRLCPCIHVALVCDTCLIWWMNWSLLALRTKYVPLSISLPALMKRAHSQNNGYIFWKSYYFCQPRTVFTCFTFTPTHHFKWALFFHLVNVSLNCLVMSFHLAWCWSGKERHSSKFALK